MDLDHANPPPSAQHITDTAAALVQPASDSSKDLPAIPKRSPSPSSDSPVVAHPTRTGSPSNIPATTGTTFETTKPSPSPKLSPGPDPSIVMLNLKPRTPKPATPKPQTTTEGSAGGGEEIPSGSRPLNVTDALSYLDAVKHQFHDKPDVYNHFLDIMKDFKSQVIDTPGVIERVSLLFTGNPELIQGFNTFLPMGYRIDISTDPRDNMITVTTPSGTTRQSTTAFAQLLPPPSNISTPGLTPPFPGAPLAALGSGPLPGSITHPIGHGYSPVLDAAYASGFPGASSTTAAASFLGNLNNRNPVEKQPAGEFNHAIQYLNKIKARYSDDPNTYKQFLEILQTYQKEQKHLQDASTLNPESENLIRSRLIDLQSQVNLQVQRLFKDAPDLLSEFKDFLPQVLGMESASSGSIGILPQPGSVGPGAPGSFSWGQGDGMSAASDKAKKPIVPPKRKKRPAEKEPTPTPSNRGAMGRVKKPKHHHKHDPPSPTFPSYQVSGSPPPPSNHARSHPHSSMQPPYQPLMPHSIIHGHMTAPEELIFFDQAKKTLEARETYEEFLKLLDMYTKDIIDVKTLVERAQLFFGDGDLLLQFKVLMGWDDKRDNVEYGPPGSIRTGPPEALAAVYTDDGQGPSYRRLPDSEIRLACSGRDELCRSVLNDIWVSHPTWASEEAGFVAHKKNSFEEALHKSEEERHEYHVHIEALTRTIAIMDRLYSRIEEMSNEERMVFKLKPDFGGSSKSNYHRILKRIYGKEPGLEVIKALQDCPAVAVPVVLARLKQKDEEWRRAQRDWNRTWREVDAKNFYKSLDHQGIVFKANDKKNITAKYFVTEIENLRATQVENRERNQPKPSCTLGSTGNQLQYTFEDTAVLHDSLKMVYSFLDHSHALYTVQERRGVEKFLRSFIPALCKYSAAEFNAACGPLDSAHNDDNETYGSLGDNGRGGRSANSPRSSNVHTGGIPAIDLRRKLLKTVSSNKDTRDSASAIGSRPSSPSQGPLEPTNHALNASTKKPEDIWIRETTSSLPAENQSSLHEIRVRRRPFFANSTFYTLLRLLQVLYSRLVTCKEIGLQLAAKKHQPLHANPVAVELGLDDPNGPSAVLAQAIEALGDQASREGANVIYMYLLDACEKVFDGELDQATYEEHMRWFFGTRAFHLFTLDKLITALVKQVQTILLDNKCRELWGLLQSARNKEPTSYTDIIRYRREAEKNVGLDDHLYRMEWDSASKSLHIQLMGTDDPSVDESTSAVGRWREYVDSFIMRHPTEWASRKKEVHGQPIYLRRCLCAEENPPLLGGETVIRISLGTYKLFYEGGCEDFMLRVRSGEEDETLRERAKARDGERQRSRLLQS